MSIEVKSVHKRYGNTTALSGIDLTVEEGEFAVVLGGARSGKTTLLRIMAGLEKVDSGRVLIDGKPLSDYPKRERPIAMVYQQFINYPNFTIYDNIASPLRLRRPKLDKAEVDRRVRDTAELLGLTGVLNHFPEAVSGGQQQRTAIARAIAKEAKYIFFDEPLANLDYKLREELRTELKRIFSERGGAIIYATAEPVDALAMGTHVGFIHEGALTQYGEARAVYDAPATADVAAYFSQPSMNLVETTCDKKGQVSFGSAVSFQLRNEAEGELLLGVRAHALRPHSGGQDPKLTARVELAEAVGSDTELHLDYDGIKLIALLQGFTRFDIGQEIDLTCDPADVFVFDKDTRALRGRIDGHAVSV